MTGAIETSLDISLDDLGVSAGRLMRASAIGRALARWR